MTIYQTMAKIIFCFFLCLISLTSREILAQTFETRWFADNSPWNVPIGKAAEVPYSAGAVRAFLDSEKKTINMNLNYWTPPVIDADSRQDRAVDIPLTGKFLKTKWMLPQVPVPQPVVDYVKSHRDTDVSICLYDRAKDGFYSFWQLAYNEADGSFSAQTGGFSPLKGPGWSALKQVVYLTWNNRELVTPSLGPAGGSNSCGGLIRIKEMRKGHIDHALSLHWPKGLLLDWDAPAPYAQYPATATDGKSLNSETSVPHGARLQLDPNLTDDQLRAFGLNEADLIVARALQIYGGYITDATPLSSTIMSINYENAFGKDKEIYGVTNPWPIKLAEHFRFVAPPHAVPLDTAASVGSPVATGIWRRF